MDSEQIHIGGHSLATRQGRADPKRLRALEHGLASIKVTGTDDHAQTPQTVQKWHDRTPDVFAIKPPRFATTRKAVAGHQGRPARPIVGLRHHTFRDRGIAPVICFARGNTQIADPTAAFVCGQTMATSKGTAAGHKNDNRNPWAVPIRAADSCPDGPDHVAAPAAGQPRHACHDSPANPQLIGRLA